ncbi:MAG: (Fe-S)-binding protein, partial [Gammaproteobacteria bacterium]|nr:(Fe-S)-binding protein [Gammaproteobacteria bacterium]
MKSIDSQPDTLNPTDVYRALQQDADSCVMCGMCLPHCPTYQVYQNESESPRGRISIVQAYAQGRIEPDAAMLLHLDHCLGCMACEAMCPSQVAYGRLIDNAQALLARHRTDRPGSLTLLLNQTSHKGGINRLATALDWYQASGLQKLTDRVLRMAGSTQIAHSNEILGQAKTARLRPFYPATSTTVADVALFTGCMGSSFDGETLQNAIKVLTRLGCNIHIPQDQQCCGALHQHHGQPDKANQLIAQNRLAFNKLPISHIIYIANGCGAQLAQYDLPAPVIDIMSFLVTTAAWETIRLKPFNEAVYIHESCSSLNKLKIAGTMRRALKRVPQLQAFEPATSVCCGAGSSHQMLFPELTEKLLRLKVHEIKESRAKYLLSDNLGCALNIKSGLSKAGIDVEVIHPITM